MKINQALKAKKRLVEEINELWEIANENNSVPAGNTIHYDVKQTITTALEKGRELAAFKAQLHIANAPVYHLIFEMSELKNSAQKLRGVPTREGKQSSRYGSNDDILEVVYNSADVKKILKEIQKRIDNIQEQLDEFNANTNV